MKKLRVKDGMGMMELAEAALHQVRMSPLPVLTPYYIGTAPFVLAFLYYWADMLQGANAWRHVEVGALLVTLAFVWMKCWHAVYCHRMRMQLIGGDTTEWNTERVARMIAAQTFIHACGCILLPLSMLMVLPFGHVYAFFQNASVFAADEDNRVSVIVKRSWEEAKRWPIQNLRVLWLLSPLPLIIAAGIQLFLMPIAIATTPDWQAAFTAVYMGMITVLVLPLSPIGTLLAFNIGILITFVPQMLKSLLGIETPFTLGGDGGGATYYAICVGAAFLCMDPVMKAAYTLRCFYGESLSSGQDLRVALDKAKLKRGARVGVVLFAIGALCCASVSHAQTPEIPPAQPGVSPEELDDAIARTLQQSEYTWRSPREIPEDSGKDSFFTLFMKSVAESVGDAFRAVARFMRWLVSLFETDGGSSTSVGGISWIATTRILLTLMLVSVLVALTIIVIRILRQRRTAEVHAIASPVEATPNLEEDDVTADALPEDGWLNLARDLIDQGELRLAMRALFLATLSVLAHRDMIRIAKYKSNREYLREVERHGHAVPEIPPVFAQSVGSFERVWYGNHSVDRAHFDVYTANQERIRALAKQH